MSADGVVLDHETLAAALAEQEDAGSRPRNYSQRQMAAMMELADAFGVPLTDILGFAMIAGHPLLVERRVPDQPSRREGGRLVVDTHVVALAGGYS